jgi:hypothetical protein
LRNHVEKGDDDVSGVRSNLYTVANVVGESANEGSVERAGDGVRRLSNERNSTGTFIQWMHHNKAL